MIEIPYLSRKPSSLQSKYEGTVSPDKTCYVLQIIAGTGLRSSWVVYGHRKRLKLFVFTGVCTGLQETPHFSGVQLLVI